MPCASECRSAFCKQRAHHTHRAVARGVVQLGTQSSLAIERVDSRGMLHEIVIAARFRNILEERGGEALGNCVHLARCSREADELRGEVREITLEDFGCVTLAIYADHHHVQLAEL